MRTSLFIFLFISFSSITVNTLWSQETNFKSGTFGYFLPEITYDQNIPTPKDFLGFEPGEWHISHDLLKSYMEKLSEASDRITLSTHGKTHENRSLQLLTITSIQNHKNIDKIRAEHLKLSDPKKSKSIDVEDMPIVIYQGYSIHGNESSGSNAAVLLAYYLAAAQGEKIDEILQNCVILLDPCMNPDGLQRFSSWVNQHKSETLVSDPLDIEFTEPWPRGRTNHYWFDLNRDWLLLTQPESQGRVKQFHRWKPNILTDHHEMGTNNTFFFQPGHPDRTNPNTPKENQLWTEAIGKFHANALDEIGALYYSKENFDDFYYGKGSTYPDVNGGIGILFEQASSRGHLQESQHGLLSFPFTIKNQLTSSFSTIDAAIFHRRDILKYQIQFYKTAKKLAKSDPVKAYKISCSEDPQRIDKFAWLLCQHDVKLYFNKKEKSIIIPTDQAQYKFIKSSFEKQTSFKDSSFYDVSGWTLPLAFNLDVQEIKEKGFKVGKSSSIYDRPNLLLDSKSYVADSAYAYIFKWDQLNSPKALNAMLNAGIKASVTHTELELELKDEKKVFQRGSIILSIDKIKNKQNAILLINKMADESGIQLYPIYSGYSASTSHLGSPKIQVLKSKNVAMLVGDGVSSYSAGEVWHLLDQEYAVRLTKLKGASLNRVNLNKYDVLILPDGNHNALGTESTEKIKNWAMQGGTLICMQNAISWAKNAGLAQVKFVQKGKVKSESKRPYEKRRYDRASGIIGGAIFKVNLDLTHPINYGYHDEEIPVFHKGNQFLELAKNPYATPARYTNNPLMSGYISAHNLNKMKGAASIRISAQGKGRIICFSDNPVFRGYFYGTNKLLANAIFFGHLIDRSTTE